MCQRKANHLKLTHYRIQLGALAWIALKNGVRASRKSQLTHAGKCAPIKCPPLKAILFLCHVFPRNATDHIGSPRCSRGRGELSDVRFGAPKT